MDWVGLGTYASMVRATEGPFPLDPIGKKIRLSEQGTAASVDMLKLLPAGPLGGVQQKRVSERFRPGSAEKDQKMPSGKRGRRRVTNTKPIRNCNRGACPLYAERNQ